MARTIAVILGWILLNSAVPQAATLPAGFSEALVASGLSSPTAMQFAPDGRLFVCEQGGQVRVIKDGVLLAQPFLSVTVDSRGERGLLGIAFDPGFAANRFVYVYYTATTPTLHNRISRFTASGDVAVAGSEVVILDLDPLSSATNHNGGALAFGPDGKLYAAVGENANPANAQSLTTVHGKMLRLNNDGSVPTDNPFYGATSGNNRAIWALGLRNPFTFAFNPGGPELFINDVGQNIWEEINTGRRGANYGWPETEGPTADPRFDAPRYAYDHAGGACAITGGAFYSPLSSRFPADYFGDYFFADFCAGWIRRFDTVSGAASGFATGTSFPVDLKVSDDGYLYYLARGTGAATGAVYRIQSGQVAPAITEHPQNVSVQSGAAATFSVAASGTAPLRYQWQRDGVAIAGATGQTYSLGSAAPGDHGARFRAVVTNDVGSAISNEAVLTVTANQPPAGAIDQPAAGTLYSGGTTIVFSGTATDPEDGTLPASAFVWRVDFHHDSHTHPFMAPTSGARSGSFTIPTTGETAATVWYRVYLTVRDSAGLTHTTHRDVLPRKATLTLATSPPGLQLRLDGQPVTTPITFESVVGITRNLLAPSPQTAGTANYEFTGWSDGGPAAHDIATPATNTTYTASYRSVAGAVNGLTATYYDGMSFTGTAVSRVDPVIDFAWSIGSPDPAIGVDTFSVRWLGQVEAPSTDSFTFHTQSDDGVRLWVNGQLLVDNWTDHGLTENSGVIALAAGQRYGIRLEFYENGGHATVKLLWSSATLPKQFVPATRLFPESAPPSSPYRDIPAAVPGVIQGEEFDEGGEGVAYRDTSAANEGGQFRSSSVDIEATSDAGGGYNVGWMAAGEWLSYSVEVSAAGTYTLETRVAANGPGGTFHVESNGTDVTGPMLVPNTGGWQNWTTVEKRGVSLPAGRQVLRLVVDAEGSSGIFGNLNFLRLTAASAPSADNVVIYAGDVPAAALRGSWTFASDATSPDGVKLITPDVGGAQLNNPLAAPIDYVEIPFTAAAGVPYTVWLRLRAVANSKWNDAVWVQFSDAMVQGAPAYRIGTTSGLLVNLATDSAATSLNGWGWRNGAYWLAQATTLTFASSGTHTIRVQIREDGVEFDQIVLSPSTYRDGPPGPVSNDSTIVPKSSP